MVQIAVDQVASVHGAIQLGQCFVIGHIELFCQIANQDGAGSVGGKDGGKPLWQSDLILIEDAQEEYCAEHDEHDEIGGQAGAQLGVSGQAGDDTVHAHSGEDTAYNEQALCGFYSFGDQFV